MQAVLESLMHWGPIVISAAAAAAATLPVGAEGSVWAKIRTGIDFLALNIGNAKNAK